MEALILLAPVIWLLTFVATIVWLRRNRLW